jgi:tetratricopeptide (TPR) repeat protein
MTTLDHVSKTCAICGREDTYTMIMSTNSFGSPDLDLRPPEMQRSTMEYWVERCPECGYCSHNVEEAGDGVADVVQSEAYRRQRESQQYPELANAFLCSSMIYEHLGDYSSAGQTSMDAAWVCDDASMQTEARQCREEAIRLLQIARDQDQLDEDPAGATEALLTDLMRRSAQFDLAQKTCEEGLAKDPETVIAGVLRFQRSLIDAKDVGAYTIEEALQAESQQ